MVNTVLLKVSSADGYHLSTYEGVIRRYMRVWDIDVTFAPIAFFSENDPFFVHEPTFSHHCQQEQKIEWMELVVTHLTIEAEVFRWIPSMDLRWSKKRCMNHFLG